MRNSPFVSHAFSLSFSLSLTFSAYVQHFLFMSSWLCCCLFVFPKKFHPNQFAFVRCIRPFTKRTELPTDERTIEANIFLFKQHNNICIECCSLAHYYPHSHLLTIRGHFDHCLARVSENNEIESHNTESEYA